MTDRLRRAMDALKAEHGRSAYHAGNWCGECRFGVTENPPCCTDASRLDELEGAEEWVEYLLTELDDLADSLDEHVTLGDVHDALTALTTRIRNGGRPPGSEPHVSGREGER